MLIVVKQLSVWFMWVFLQKVSSLSMWSAANFSFTSKSCISNTAASQLMLMWNTPDCGHWYMSSSSFSFIADLPLDGFWLTLDHPDQFSLSSRWKFVFFLLVVVTELCHALYTYRPLFVQLILEHVTALKWLKVTFLTCSNQQCALSYFHINAELLRFSHCSVCGWV